MHLGFLLYFGLLLIGPAIVFLITLPITNSLIDIVEEDRRLSRRSKDIIQAGLYLDQHRGYPYSNRY